MQPVVDVPFRPLLDDTKQHAVFNGVVSEGQAFQHGRVDPRRSGRTNCLREVRILWQGEAGSLRIIDSHTFRLIPATLDRRGHDLLHHLLPPRDVSSTPDTAPWLISANQGAALRAARCLKSTITPRPSRTRPPYSWSSPAPSASLNARDEANDPAHPSFYVSCSLNAYCLSRFTSFLSLTFNTFTPT